MAGAERLVELLVGEAGRKILETQRALIYRPGSPGGSLPSK